METAGKCRGPIHMCFFLRERCSLAWWLAHRPPSKELSKCVSDELPNGWRDAEERLCGSQLGRARRVNRCSPSGHKEASWNSLSSLGERIPTRSEYSFLALQGLGFHLKQFSYVCDHTFEAVSIICVTFIPFAFSIYKRYFETFPLWI